MRIRVFAGRNFKEILRDPVNLGFGLGFPVILILLLSAIQANIPVGMFEIETLTPGITVFGLSFMTLFSATLIAKDREMSFFQRLYATPLTPGDFIFGYAAPMVVISVAQSVVCYIAALCLGLEVTANIFLAILVIAPVSLLYVGLGLLCGSVLNVKQAGGVCGALFINLSAWLSGTWFDLELVGGALKKVAYALPFVHCVEMERAVLSGNWKEISPHVLWVIGYALAAIIAAVLLFVRQMKRQ